MHSTDTVLESQACTQFCKNALKEVSAAFEEEGNTAPSWPKKTLLKANRSVKGISVYQHLQPNGSFLGVRGTEAYNNHN